MESKSILIISTLLLVAMSASASVLLGGYQPIKDPSDWYVEEIGTWAVNEHNKQVSTSFVFLRVISGETQEVDGINYKLRINAKVPGGSDDGAVFEAVVNDKPSASRVASRTLISFQLISSEKD